MNNRVTITNNQLHIVRSETYKYSSGPDIIKFSILIGFYVLLMSFLKVQFAKYILLSADLQLALWIIRIVCWFIIIPYFSTLVSSATKVLTIRETAIVQNSGIFVKKEMLLPVDKIKLVNKSRGPLQSIFHCLTISITTSGDTHEVCFRNIKNGKSAYLKIKNLIE